MTGKKKVPERRSGLRPSEKELPELRSVTKIPLIVRMTQLLLTFFPIFPKQFL
jgi:hypothetical protein